MDVSDKYYGEKLTPSDFLKNQDAQEAVFKGEFGRLVEKYGPEGAARAWYAGEKGMDNLSATDINKKTTVGDYGAKFAKAVGAPMTVPASMSPQDAARKYAGQRVRLPDGTVGSFPAPTPPISR